MRIIYLQLAIEDNLVRETSLMTSSSHFKWFREQKQRMKQLEDLEKTYSCAEPRSKLLADGA